MIFEILCIIPPLALNMPLSTLLSKKTLPAVHPAVMPFLVGHLCIPGNPFPCLRHSTGSSRRVRGTPRNWAIPGTRSIRTTGYAS